MYYVLADKRICLIFYIIIYIFIEYKEKKEKKNRIDNLGE